jgi:hypothetical protein
MNVFTKRMTMGFVLALLIAMLISYGGMKRKIVPLYAEEVEQQSLFAVFIQDLRAFLGDSPATILAYDYYSGVEFPLPSAYSVIDGRPF